MNYDGARALLEQPAGSANVTTLRGLLRDALDEIDELRAQVEAEQAAYVEMMEAYDHASYGPPLG